MSDGSRDFEGRGKDDGSQRSENRTSPLVSQDGKPVQLSSLREMASAEMGQRFLSAIVWYAIRNVQLGTYWTGNSWSEQESQAKGFRYHLWAENEAAEINGGVGLSVEKMYGPAPAVLVPSQTALDE